MDRDRTVKPADDKGPPRNELRGAAPRQQRPRASTRDYARRVLTELRSLGKALAEEYGVTWSEAFPVETLVLPVAVRLGRSSPSEIPLTDAEHLVRDYSARLQEALKGLHTFRPGRVYCFQCGQPACKHSAPESPEEVFAGYSATGKPTWHSFPNLCLARGDPRVEQLYGSVPALITFVQQAGELKGELLPAFGKGALAFNVLGQVVAGLVPGDFRVDGRSFATERLALTFQVLETMSDLEKRRLRLNIIGLSADEIAQVDEDSESGNPAGRLRSALRTARDRLNGVGRLLARSERGGKRIDLDRAVLPVLNELRNDVERIFRPDRRRTQHAKERHQAGDRPTRVALTDARNASDERLFLDVFHDTVVAVGPRGRAHVFTMDGRHVTSLDLQPGEVDRKTGRGRWRPLDQGAAEAFRKKLEPEG